MNTKVINGTTFHDETPIAVCNILNDTISSRRLKRIRIFFGDKETGKDWNEFYDNIGYVGRSTGLIKIPLMIHNTRSTGGGAILDHCIVKITVDKKTVYQHPKYHCPIVIKGCSVIDTEDNKVIANCKDAEMAKRYFDYLKGARNNY